MSYDTLALIPTVIAEEVVDAPYTGRDLSIRIRSSHVTEKIEQRRRAMTASERQHFIAMCDTLCRQAYEARAPWFMKCVNAKGNRGRNQLYVWLTHWLHSSLRD